MNKAPVFASCTLLFCIAAACVIAQEDLPQGNRPQGQAGGPVDSKHYSYAIGLDLGSNFRTNQVQLHLESLLAGVQDGLGGAKPQLDEKTCRMALQQLQRQMQEKARVRQQSQGMKNKEASAAFLANNRQQEGVKVTKSGLQYRVVTSGDGPTPGPTDVVSCHYRGTLTDGTEFDSSYSRNMPAEFPVNRVIAGWTEALQLMKVGDKWQLFIPAELAYGDDPPGGVIEAGSTLVFDIELLGIVEK